MDINQLETPCLLLDKAKLLNNIDKLAKHLSALGVPLRPHVKTTKSIDVLRLVMGPQARGITVSTLKEADYFLDQGVTDILYAVGIAPHKLDHVAELRRRGGDITIVLDSIEQAQAVAQKGRELNMAFPALIEVDTDGHRSGVQPGDPALIEIGRLLHEAGAMKGIMAHGGESYSCNSIAEIKAIAAQERELSVRCANALREAGIPCPVVSIGSTPTASLVDDLTGITEVRAGVYLFQDLTIAGLDVCSVDDIAISVLATVIGYQKDKNWVITDSGWTSLSSDRGTASQRVDQGYGVVCDVNGKVIPDLIVKATNQEHGIIGDRNGGPIDYSKFPIGTLVRVLPNHACATAAAHDGYHVLEGRKVVALWPRIHGW